MKKLAAKMRKVKMTKWNMLSTGEKVMKVVMKLVKWAVIAAAVVGLFSVVIALGFVFLMLVAMGGFVDTNLHNRRK